MVFVLENELSYWPIKQLWVQIEWEIRIDKNMERLTKRIDEVSVADW